MPHQIIEITPWDGRRVEIATAENFANAYTIAQLMSEKHHEVIYEAVNGNIERTITYKGGELVSDIKDGRDVTIRDTHDPNPARRNNNEYDRLDAYPASSQAGLQAIKNRQGVRG